MINFRVIKEPKSKGMIDTSIISNEIAKVLAKKLTEKFKDVKCETHPDFINTATVNAKGLKMTKNNFCCQVFSDKIILKS
ncbi:MAG: hypothetical protein ACYDCN_11865 [Bacteroidia bacterium]